MLAELLPSGNVRLELTKDHPNFSAILSHTKAAYAKQGIPLRFAKTGDTDAHLAQWYVDLFNLIKDAGGEIDQKMMDIVDQEFEDTEYVIHHDEHTGRWELEGDEEPDQYARVHAPPGGVSVNGEIFRGGRFVPNEKIAQASWEERQALYGHGKRGDRNMDHIDGSQLEWLADKTKRPASEVSKEKKARLMAMHDAIHRRYGNKTKHRLAEHAREIKAQMGKTKSPSYKRKLSTELGQVIGIMAIAGGEEPGEPDGDIGQTEGGIVITVKKVSRSKDEKLDFES